MPERINPKGPVVAAVVQGEPDRLDRIPKHIVIVFCDHATGSSLRCIPGSRCRGGLKAWR
jgi:hypothetical protein